MAPTAQSTPILEHGTTRTGRWLRERRIRIAVWIAMVEGVLVVVHVVPRWPAILIAAVLVLAWRAFGRESRVHAVRQASWIAATSQALMVLVPILFLIVGAVALIVVGILAVLALVVLFAERR